MRWVRPCIAHTCILDYINLLARAVLAPAYFLISSDLQDRPGMPPLPTFRKTYCLDTPVSTRGSTFLSMAMGFRGSISSRDLSEEIAFCPMAGIILILMTLVIRLSRERTLYTSSVLRKFELVNFIDAAVRGLWNRSWKDTCSPSPRVLADISRLERTTCHSSSTSRRYSSKKQSLG